MAVDVVGEAGLQLGQLGRFAGDDTWKVHHLRHSDHTFVTQETFQIGRRKWLQG